METKERILATASAMFLEKGVAAVGMRDIFAAAQLTQGGFYRHFESKEELIAEAISRALDRLIAMLEDETNGKSPAEAVEKIVSIYLRQSRGKQQPYLCPLAMLGAELSHCNPQVRAVARAGYKRLVQLVENRLQSLVKTGAPVLASAIVSTMVGAVTLANIASDPATASSIVSNAQAFIRSHLSSCMNVPRTKKPVLRRSHSRS